MTATHRSRPAGHRPLAGRLHRALGPALLVAATLGGAPDAVAGGPDTWAVAEGRLTVEPVAWPRGCGPRPEPGAVDEDARYLRRGLALVPVDDAPPLFGPGICRGLLGDADEVPGGADIACTGNGTASARLALRQTGPDTLSVVHQVRRAPTDGCVAEITGTWLLTRVVDGAPRPLPPTGAARAGSLAALAPIAPPALPPPPIAVPPSTSVDVSAEVRPPPAPPLAGERLPLFALSGLLIIAGLLGLLRARRGTG